MMGPYEGCMHCGTTSPASEYCPKCGKRRGKWCPKCQTWKAAEFHSLDVNYDLQAVLAEDYEEALFCPHCGTELQTKGAPHE